jgi:hypothetical protein
LTWNLDAVGQEVAPVDHAWSSGDTLLDSLGVRAGVHDPFGFELEFTTANGPGEAESRVESEPGTVVIDQGRLVYREVDPDHGRSPAREPVVR